MPKQVDTSSINYRAKTAGLNPATVYNRMSKGMSVEDALATPARKYSKQTKRKPVARDSKKSDLVWQYLIENKLATPAEVSRETGVSYGYVHRLMKKVGTPREVFVREETLRRIDDAWNSVDFDSRSSEVSYWKLSTVFLLILVVCLITVGVSLVWK